MKREEAFNIHGKFCRKCSSVKNLEINHKNYRNIYDENVKEDLEVLCKKCHREYHGIKGYKKETKFQRKKRLKKRRVNEGYAMTMDEYREKVNKSIHKSTMAK